MSITKRIQVSIALFFSKPLHLHFFRAFYQRLTEHGQNPQVDMERANLRRNHLRTRTWLIYCDEMNDCVTAKAE